MSTKPPPLSTFAIWTQTLQIIHKNYKEIIPLFSLLLLCPQLVFTISFAQFSVPVVENIKSLVSLHFTNHQALDYKVLLAPASQFFTLYLFCGFIVILLALFTYIAFTVIALNHSDLLPTTDTKYKSLYKTSIKLLLPKGLLIFLGVAILSLEQFIFGPFHVFSILALMAIILIILEKNGAISSVWRALTLKYVTKTPARGFSTFVIVLSTGILIYAYEASLNFLTKNILILDQWLTIPRTFWEYRLPGFPCSLVFLIVELIWLLGYSALLAFLAFFTVTLYGHVRKKLSERT